jgi:enoyl-CoA hydratase/carnithine racemase
MLCSPLAVRYTKELAMTALEGPEWTESRITQRLEVWEKLIKLADTREGIDAFQHKRKPQWNAR